MLKTEHPSNIKSNEWYKKFYSGVFADCETHRDKYIRYIKIIQERDKKGGFDDIPKEAMELYNELRKHNEYFSYYIACDNFEDNRKYLSRCSQVLDLLQEVYYIVELKEKEKLLSDALNRGYLITTQLTWLIDVIEDIAYSEIGLSDEDCSIYILDEGKEWEGLVLRSDGKHELEIFKAPLFNFEKLKNLFTGPTGLQFDMFRYSEEEIYALIRAKAKWHDIERDLLIYQEKQKGKYLRELAEEFGIKFNSVSDVVKKVQSAINFYKGKLFEDFIEKRLKESKLFKSVIKEAGSGEPDILAYTKDDKELYIYSLKNIQIDRKPYWLEKEELQPEIDRARQCHWDYTVHLILLVFDNHNNIVKQFQVDYNNPVNIDISK